MSLLLVKTKKKIVCLNVYSKLLFFSYLFYASSLTNFVRSNEVGEYMCSVLKTVIKNKNDFNSISQPSKTKIQLFHSQFKDLVKKIEKT